MNKDKMLEWADHLESPKYEGKQVRGGWGQLTERRHGHEKVYDEGRFCCLNVAVVEFFGKDAGLFEYGGFGARQALTELFDIPDDRPQGVCIQRFINMNDYRELSFKAIAREIRKYVRKAQ